MDTSAYMASEGSGGGVHHFHFHQTYKQHPILSYLFGFDYSRSHIHSRAVPKKNQWSSGRGY